MGRRWWRGCGDGLGVVGVGKGKGVGVENGGKVLDKVVVIELEFV